MSNFRRTVKQIIAAAVTPAIGVKKVYLYRPKDIPQTSFPSVVVNLAKSKETRATASAPRGKKIVHYVAHLEVVMIDMTADGSGALAFDDLLDAIDDELRKDPQLGRGDVILGATIEHIDTDVAPPTLLNGQVPALIAIKTFDVSIMTTG